MTVAAPSGPRPGAREDRDESAVPPRGGAAAVVLPLCVPFAVAAALVGMIATGAFATGRALYDPGAFVVYGLPVVRVLHDLAAAATVGLLVLAAIILPGQTKRHGEVGFSQWRATRWAGWAAALWLGAGLIGIVLETVEVSDVGLGDPGFLGTLATFAFTVSLGRSLLVSAAAVATVLVLALTVRRTTGVGIAAALALFALLPLALSGHAAGSFEHGNAVDSLAVHLLGATVWAGGLFGLIALRGTVRGGFGRAVRRYSSFAGWAFAAVAASGIVNAWLRLGDLAHLFTPYGALILVKASVLVLLGVAGAFQRRRVVPGLLERPRSRRLFARFAVTEAVLMSLAFGVAVALSKSPPPQNQVPTGRAATREALLGFPYPPPVTPLRILTQWHFEWMWVGAAVALVVLYLWAVRRLRLRGVPWPLYRTICWILGCASLVWITSGGPAVYGHVHFSSHMLQHMGLMMLVPPLLVLGGPILLALRALPSRHDGSRGLREWILVATHSRYLAILSRPAVAGAIFAGSLVIFYFSPLFELALRTHVGHTLMYLHFLGSGYLFFWVFIGVDPGPRKSSYPMMFVTLLATLAFHAFFGVAIMGSTELLASGWWHALGQTNDAALLTDQHTAGGIAWGAGEIPMVLVALGLAIMWTQADERQAKRLDRKAERDGDADLNAYNARLAAMAARDDER